MLTHETWKGSRVVLQVVIDFLTWWDVVIAVLWSCALFSFYKASIFLAFPYLYDPDKHYDYLVKWTRIAMWFLIACETVAVYVH